MNTVRTLYNKYFKDKNVVIDDSRKEIRYKGLELHQRKTDYAIAIRMSNIKTQAQLDMINRNYGILVHYGTAKHYQEPIWDLSNCQKINNSNEKDAKKCYLSCDYLNEEKAIELFSFLIEQQ